MDGRSAVAGPGTRAFAGQAGDMLAGMAGSSSALGPLELGRVMWLEGRAGAEQLALLADPVFRGRGVRRGGGRAVLLIPGFMAGDWSLGLLAGWLRRMGYRPRASGILVNARHSEPTLAGLVVRLREAAGSGGTGVTLVGHSRGGVLAKVLAERNPGLVDQVIPLGSPLGAPMAVHPATLAAIRAARMSAAALYRDHGPERPGFVADLAAPAAVPTTSIYSRSDAIVDWRACIRPDMRCIEVSGSHVGLAGNRAVYRILGDLLEPVPAAAA